MAFEPIYEVAALGGLQKLCSGQVVAEAKLVPPHGEEIVKILGTSAICDVIATEVFTGEARIKGRVDFKVLYLISSGESRCLDYRAEFGDKIESELIEGGKPCVCAKVLDTDIVSASGGEVKLAAVVEIELFGERSKRIKYLSSGGDGVFLDEKSVKCTRVLSSLGGSVEVMAEAELSAAMIESVESRVCVSKAVCSANVVTVEGEVVSSVIYSGEGGIMHTELVTPFSLEVEAEGTTAESRAYVVARLEDVKAVLGEKNPNTLSINYDISVCGFVLEEREMSFAADAFSLGCELNKVVEKFEVPYFKGLECFGDEVDGSVALKADMPIADSIVAPLGSSVLVSSAYATLGKVVVEGLVRSNVVYFSGETSSYNSVFVEVPFSVSKPLDVAEGDAVYATAEVLRVGAKLRRGNEIELRAELRICVAVGENVELGVIGELSEGKEISVPHCAISMHIAGKRESLWDVARALCIAPDEVLRQNPELAFPLSGGERVVTFRQHENVTQKS